MVSPFLNKKSSAIGGRRGKKNPETIPTRGSPRKKKKKEGGSSFTSSVWGESGSRSTHAPVCRKRVGKRGGKGRGIIESLGGIYQPKGCQGGRGECFHFLLPVKRLGGRGGWCIYAEPSVSEENGGGEKGKGYSTLPDGNIKKKRGRERDHPYVLGWERGLTGYLQWITAWPRRK